MTSITPSNINTDNLLLNGAFKYWYSGTSSAPDGWSLASGSVERESTEVPDGFEYSTKITSDGGDASQFYNTNRDVASFYTYLQGKTVTLLAWVHADDASMVRISIYDGSSWHYSSYHTGGGDWELLTVTATIKTTATNVMGRFSFDAHAGEIAYITGMQLNEGSIPFAYTEHKQDVVGMEVTSAPSVVGADYERAWYSSGGTRRLYMCDGSDWKYVAIST
jgi:hypothetical protein